MNIRSRTVCALTTTLLALNAAALDWSDATRMIPFGAKSEPAPSQAAEVQVSHEDRVLAGQLNVFLGEEPVATAGDKQCEKVVAVDPLDVLSNAGKNTLNTDSVVNALGGLLKGQGISVDEAKSKALEVLRQELKRQVWLPLIVEDQIGQVLLKQRSDTLVDVEDPQAEEVWAKVKPIFDGLVATTANVQPYKPKLLLYMDDNGQPNAEALPGGIILMNMVLAQSEPERIAGYLSHELGHVAKRHYVIATQAKLIDSVKTVQEIQDMVKGSDGKLFDLVMKGINLQGQAFTRYYSNQELEADGCGAKFLASNRGSEGHTSIEKFLEDIEASTKAKSEEETQTAEPLLFKDLHPTYTDRRQTLEKSFQHWLSATAAR